MVLAKNKLHLSTRRSTSSSGLSTTRMIRKITEHVKTSKNQVKPVSGNISQVPVIKSLDKTLKNSKISSTATSVLKRIRMTSAMKQAEPMFNQVNPKMSMNQTVKPMKMERKAIKSRQIKKLRKMNLASKHGYKMGQTLAQASLRLTQPSVLPRFIKTGSKAKKISHTRSFNLDMVKKSINRQQEYSVRSSWLRNIDSVSRLVRENGLE